MFAVGEAVEELTKRGFVSEVEADRNLEHQPQPSIRVQAESRLGDPGPSEWDTSVAGSSHLSGWQVAGSQLVDYSAWNAHRRYEYLRGFDLRTGAERWHWTTPADCWPEPEKLPVHIGEMFAVELDCWLDLSTDDFRRPLCVLSQ